MGLISPSCRLSELEAEHTTPLDPMAGFEKIIRHNPQWDNPDRCKDNPHKVEPENLPPAHRGLRPGGNNLYGCSVEMG